MGQCKYHEICGREAIGDGGLCILHSEDPGKDEAIFFSALDEHRQKNGDNYYFFVFPDSVSFQNARFTGKVVFSRAKFTGRADFFRAHFDQVADFSGAEFCRGARFGLTKFDSGAQFSNSKFIASVDFSGTDIQGQAQFGEARFSEEADFGGAQFKGEAVFLAARFEGKTSFLYTDFTQETCFSKTHFAGTCDFSVAHFTLGSDFFGAHFVESVDFSKARFNGEADLREITFEQGANFRRARISGKTMFSSAREGDGFIPITFGHEVDFRDVIVNPTDALAFRDADLCTWRFLGTDLRKAEFTNVKWPPIKRRWTSTLGVYDEKLALRSDDEEQPWAHIERLYRELKQNHEDRRDYERAGDFHYGEKETRRKHAKGLGPRYWGLRFLLFLYCWVGGYGEKALRPLVWAFLLLVGCAVAYGTFGLETPPPNSTPVPLAWYEAGRYSLQVMTLLKPNLVPVGEVGKWIHTFESIVGPLLIGLFALALRQRLKR